MNAKAMTEDGIAEALSTSAEIKKSVCRQILNSLALIFMFQWGYKIQSGGRRFKVEEEDSKWREEI